MLFALQEEKARHEKSERTLLLRPPAKTASTSHINPHHSTQPHFLAPLPTQLLCTSSPIIVPSLASRLTLLVIYLSSLCCTSHPTFGFHFRRGRRYVCSRIHLLPESVLVLVVVVLQSSLPNIQHHHHAEASEGKAIPIGARTPCQPITAIVGVVVVVFDCWRHPTSPLRLLRTHPHTLHNAGVHPRWSPL